MKRVQFGLARAAVESTLPAVESTAYLPRSVSDSGSSLNSCSVRLSRAPSRGCYVPGGGNKGGSSRGRRRPRHGGAGGDFLNARRASRAISRRSASALGIVSPKTSSSRDCTSWRCHRGKPHTIRATGITPAATILRVSTTDALTRRHRVASSRSTGHGYMSNGSGIVDFGGLADESRTDAVPDSVMRSGQPGNHNQLHRLKCLRTDIMTWP